MPREIRNDEIVVSARTVAWPPVMCSLFACAGAAPATRHRPVASAPTVVFDTRDICKLLGTGDGTWLRETPLAHSPKSGAAYADPRGCGDILCVAAGRAGVLTRFQAVFTR